MEIQKLCYYDKILEIAWSDEEICTWHTLNYPMFVHIQDQAKLSEFLWGILKLQNL